MKKLFNCIRTIESASLSSAKKYYEDNKEFFTPEFFDYLVEIDTTRNKKYVEGFLRMFKKETENPMFWVDTLYNPVLDVSDYSVFVNHSGGRRWTLIVVDDFEDYFSNYLKAIQAGQMNPELTRYTLTSFISDSKKNILRNENREYPHLLNGGIYRVLKKFKEGKDYELREDNENFIAIVPLDIDFANEFAGPKVHWCVCRRDEDWESYRDDGIMFIFVFDKKTELLYMVEVQPEDVYYWTWKNDEQFEIKDLPVEGFDPEAEYARNNIEATPVRDVIDPEGLFDILGLDYKKYKFLKPIDLERLVYLIFRADRGNSYDIYLVHDPIRGASSFDCHVRVFSKRGEEEKGLGVSELSRWSLKNMGYKEISAYAVDPDNLSGRPSLSIFNDYIEKVYGGKK